MAVKLRGALLGVGNIAQKSHLRQWTQDAFLRERVEIVAAADLSPANLDAARAVLPDLRAYASTEELLDRERLDFCDVCTPPNTRLQILTDAAKRGLHVLCEKPLAPSMREASEIATAIRRAHVVFAACHQYRYSPQWQTVARWLPRLGKVHLVKYEVQRTEANPGNAAWAPSWRTDAALAGGGILVDHGAHIFYQMHSLFGEPRRVQAVVRNLLHHDYGVEDSAFVCLEYAERLVWVWLTWAARRRRIHYEFDGQNGALTGDDEQARVDSAGEQETCSFDEGMSRDSAHSDWYAPLMRGFVEQIERRDPSDASLNEALFVMRLIELAYESARTGCTLDWSPAPPA